jgi:hypothetical protein
MQNAMNTPVTIECISNLDEFALETLLIDTWTACREYRRHGMDAEAEACHAACYVIIARANEVMGVTPEDVTSREQLACKNVIAQIQWNKKSNNFMDTDTYAELEAMTAFEAGVHPQVPYLAAALLY